MERNHTPYEVSEVECKDCFCFVLDADEEYCRACGDPTCDECSQSVADEALCVGCFSSLTKVALESLRRDSLIGDLFEVAA